ncbi:MAG TPA: DinB family protein [Anaerolineales bacterium]|nr:DinB family protein [Anaerolineales bacterium]
MHHTREEVIRRTIQEFELLDNIISNMQNEDWGSLLLRPETKDQWTVKDAVAHITHWKADVARKIRKLPIPSEERGLDTNEGNHLIYLRWHERSPQEVLAWHKQVQDDLLDALRTVPGEYFSDKERNEQWPYDLDGHSAFHRVKDIERSLKSKRQGKK